MGYKALAVLASGLALYLLAAGAQARTLEQIKSGGSIVVATEGAYAPFNYYSDDKLSGFEVDLAEAIASRMGVKVEWKAAPFDSLLPGLRQDRWDLVMASLGVTDERAKSATFTAPQYCSGGVIVAKDPAISNVGTLAGKVVAAQSGTTYLQNLEKVPGVREVKAFPENMDGKSALMAGIVDAWVTDRFSAKQALEANPKAGLHEGDYLFIEKIAGAVKKNNAGLANAINKAMTELMADGTFGTLSRKYFSEDIRCR